MKRRVGLILLLLVAGAIVSVAVAWGLAVSMNLVDAPFTYGRASEGASRWQGMVKSGVGTYLFTSSWWMNNPPLTYADRLTLSEVVPSWSPAGHASPLNPADVDKSKWHADVIEARGWPMLAMFDWVEKSDSERRRRAGIALEFWQWKSSAGATWSRVLPTRPIWPGFLINTLFYAGLLWLPFGALALRRWNLIKRGLCPKCAYPVGDSPVCTECGTSHTVTSKAA